MRFYPLEKLINLHEGYSRRFKIDALQLLLLQRAGELYLLEANCPHRDYPLGEAAITNGVVQCPLHGYRFAISDGRLLHAGDEPCRGLRTWPVAYEGTDVGVVMDDPLSNGAPS